MTFADTKILCIQENGRYGDNRFKLNYFHYGDDKPFLVYESKELEWTYEYMTRKANNHSMVCWFKGRHDDFFEFRTFDFRDDPAGKLNIYKFKNEIGIPYGMAKT